MKKEKVTLLGVLDNFATTNYENKSIWDKTYDLSWQLRLSAWIGAILLLPFWILLIPFFILILFIDWRIFKAKK